MNEIPHDLEVLRRAAALAERFDDNELARDLRRLIAHTGYMTVPSPAEVVAERIERREAGRNYNTLGWAETVVTLGSDGYDEAQPKSRSAPSRQDLVYELRRMKNDIAQEYPRGFGDHDD